MEAIAVAQLKADFSGILSKIEQTGEGVIVEYGRLHRKVAVLLPYSPAYEQQAERQFGILQGKGKVEFHDDFAMTEEMLLGL
jgi:antitoxin (DNA-binding transcriptional repressor) of toxin-antitoxin stability system